MSENRERPYLLNKLFGRFFSVQDWKKNYKELIIMFLITLWRITAAKVDIAEKRTETAQHELRDCNEARTNDLKINDKEKQRYFDIMFDQAMRRSTDKYIKPKLDSIINL